MNRNYNEVINNNNNNKNNLNKKIIKLKTNHLNPKK